MFSFVFFCLLDHIYGLGRWERTRFCSGPNVHTKVSCLEGFISLQILRTSSEFFCMIYCIKSLSVSVAHFYTILYLAYACNICSTWGNIGWKKWWQLWKNFRRLLKLFLRCSVVSSSLHWRIVKGILDPKIPHSFQTFILFLTEHKRLRACLKLHSCYIWIFLCFIHT